MDILIPIDAIRVNHGQTTCPSCNSSAIPAIVDYWRQTMENPERWSIRRLYVLFQCKQCGGLHYVYEEKIEGEVPNGI